MLCVLREDFLLELRGIVGDDFGPLDDNDTAFRRSGAVRGSCCARNCARGGP
jgi:hypothetical protein